MVVVDGDQLGDEVVAAVGTEGPAGQVDRAVGHVEGHGVGVELVDSDGDTGLGGGQGQHVVDPRGGLGLEAEPEPLLVAGGPGLVEDVLPDGLGPPVGLAGDVLRPAPAVPRQPGPELGDVAEVVAVLVDETFGVSEVGLLVVVGLLGLGQLGDVRDGGHALTFCPARSALAALAASTRLPRCSRIAQALNRV